MAETVAAHPAAAGRRATASYGPFARWLLHRLFDAVPFPEESVAPLREAAAKSTLVYVLRSSSLLHLLFVNWKFWQLRLPLARAATGLGSRIFGPFARWLLGGSQVKAPRGASDRATARVIEAVRRGEAAMVFLRLPRTLPSAVAQLPDPFPALVALQRETPDRPITLVPLTLLWRKRPKKLAGSWRDALFGDPEEPGALRLLIGFLINRRRAFVKVGGLVDLRDVDAMQPDAEPSRIARRVRGFLHQQLAREARVVTGPPLKPPQRVVEETLRDLQLRRTLAEIARERGRADGSVEREARRDLREIAARYNGLAVDLIKGFLNLIFNRIYDGIDVDERGMKRLAEASARAPLVLCPSHKSHIDYMILSMVCDDYGLQPPHVAAGENLDFFPVGRLLRMGGAFFIRRSFKGDRVYQATMAAYVKRLLQDGFTQEFFVEGGRSRTGKLLQPKFGMLSLEVDAWLTGVRPDVYFAPISISYEKIVEARSYQRELLGGEKQKEDAKALLGATSVLRSRYGRITIRVDEPISLAQLFRERGVDPKNHTAEERRRLVQNLGLRIAAGINAATPLAPIGLASAALLSHDRRALSSSDLLERASFLHRVALDCGAHAASDPASAQTLRDSGLLQRALESLTADGTLRRQEAGGEVFYSVPDERRIQLDYHKNAILHFVVEPAILAAALRSFGGRPAAKAEVELRAKNLSRLLKHELIFPPGRTFDATVEDNLALLVRWGLATRDGELVVATARGARQLRLLAELLRSLCEGLWIAADALRLLLAGPMDPKEWTKAALDRGRAAWLAGRVLRIEALLKPTLDNAVLLFRDRGVFAPAEGKGAKLQLAPEVRNEDRIAALLREIEPFLS